MKKTIFLLPLVLWAAIAAAQQTTNKPEREAWFMDLGFGMFIHWSLDSQVGAVISHSMAGASNDYLQRFTTELPKTFNPKKFDPEEWAVLAKLAGMKYVVFTAKHHSGFCMWNTQTTKFQVMQTPFKRDILKEVIEAFRKQGIAIGLYFSPEDFYFLYQHQIPIGRLQHPQHYPANNAELMAYDKRQIKELLTNYGTIDVLFFDGPAEGLKEYAWQLQPNVVVTRGQMNTPEQTLPDQPIPGPWEACFTMGTDWQYKPTNDPHKSGTEIINMLIETRAKGGNLLLNVGPKPNGEIQIEQEALLREVALWQLVNQESIAGIRPWPLIREGHYWFTKAKEANAVYVFVPGGKEWKYGERKDFIFHSLEGSPQTKVQVLGYASELVEYRQGFDASLSVQPTAFGLAVSVVNGQRLYTNNQWPNPVVLKITNVTYKPLLTKEKRDTIDGAH
ncbi:alpha-L-fucosidase [Siphonobacter curvatus]|uniref:alpha-L-fucosidase n=1 Tax=Siphonobacter curvatus TaxID=2094562 RepID=A0A2S7IHR5_9BACT|nr:alpha-L-fucosidase [Siphonobacter curvatus]PQA55551.1 alpha-L-fucosidase [Siphonobacter curvatus]